MEKYYRFRIYPNKKQEELIQKTFGCCRFVYNHFLAERIEWYKKNGEYLDRFKQDKFLTALKRENEWLREPDKWALQNAMKDLDFAYKNFFRRVKQGKKPGYPKFKSKKTHRKSYKSQYSNGNIKVFCKSVQLPKLGLVKCRVSKKVDGRILSASVVQNSSGKYFVSICCTDINVQQLPKTGAVVGVDLGIKDLAITSDGIKYQNKKYRCKDEDKIARLHRELDRKSRGSNRWNKARIKLAREYEKITNQRKDSINKITTELVKNYDVIVIENLIPSNMVKNHSLSKSIGDSSFGKFRRQLEYKSGWYGRRVVVVDKWFPSSQLCSVCGERWRNARNMKIREWTCPNCGSHHDRDVNAAKNILAEGMRLLA